MSLVSCRPDEKYLSAQRNCSTWNFSKSPRERKMFIKGGAVNMHEGVRMRFESIIIIIIIIIVYTRL